MKKEDFINSQSLHLVDTIIVKRTSANSHSLNKTKEEPATLMTSIRL